MVADATDRFQTMIWMKLRREIPDLRWEECAEIDIVIDEGARRGPYEARRLPNLAAFCRFWR
jgi:hypothetical protein